MQFRLHTATSIVSVLALTVSGCGEKKPPPPPPPTVLVAPVLKEDVPVYSEFVGTLDGYINVDIRARVAGFLQTQDYKDGSYVKEGSLLFTIDPRQYQADVSQAQGQLGQAQALLTRANITVQRYRPLAAKQAISQQDLDNAIASQQSAQGQVESARGSLQQAQLNLSYTKIYSPVNGVAGTAQVRIGNLVGQGTPTLLTTVSQVDPIRVVFNVAEADYLRFAPQLSNVERLGEAAIRTRLDTVVDGGSAGTVSTSGLQLILADNSTYKYGGFIISAQRQIQTTTGTLQIEAVFPNPEALLRPGQYARVRGQRPGSGKDTLIVPQKAVSEMQGSFSVAVVTPENKVQIRRVEVGSRVGKNWIITQGVNAGERVIVEGVQKVTEGSEVKAEPVPPDAAPPPSPAR
jgi:membrane fusion protein (multidrug efflux system)